jgi:hypothetical protein
MEMNERMMRRPNCCGYGNNITRRDFTMSMLMFRES